MLLELEESAGLAVDETFPDVDVRSREMRGKPFVGPLGAVRPVPLRADVAIQPSIVIGGDVVTMHEAHAVVRVRWPELLERPKLEICANDFDGRTQFDLSFSR